MLVKIKNAKVLECIYKDIEFIPILFKKNLEYATFTKKKRPEVWFKAVSNERILGCGALLLLSKTTVRACNLFVIPKYRGNKIAQKIIIARENWAIENKYKKIDVRTVKKYYADHNYTKVQKFKVGGWSWEKKLS